MTSFIYDMDVPKEIPEVKILINMTEQAVDIEKKPYELFNEKNYEHYKKMGTLKMCRAAYDKLNNCIITSFRSYIHKNESCPYAERFGKELEKMGYKVILNHDYLFVSW